MKQFIQSHRRSIGIMSSITALTVAFVYLVVVPSEASEAAGITKAILLYGHSLCWFLLAIASGLWVFKKFLAARNILLYSALGIYAIFMITLIAN